ncbi:SDR family oxidoreductase [Ferrovibrio sp.]|uniref:SDR family NAD(P)-dependent oxidoreductase n=1 Tax=Ferrovibrio sp. TaxID=1917215 RepID=UPI0025BEF9A1|nr:SDR family oxidoreductase [Ferrovibrio sp.]
MSDQPIKLPPRPNKIPFAADLLAGNTVLISGAGGGLGGATARLAGKLGAQVVLVGRTEAKLDAVRAEIEAAGGKAVCRSVDVRNRTEVDTLYAWLNDTLGPPDILVNSAGGQFPQAAIDYSEKGWNAVINTNLNGTFHMMQAAARLWRDTKHPGSIVNVVVEPRGLHGVAHTLAARSAVIAFSNAVSVEWGPLGIRVNCVAPGLVRTDGWKVYSPEAVASYMRCNPLMDVGSAEEIAEACIYVASPAASYMTGAVITIDGGSQHWGEIWTTGKPDYFRNP